MALSRASLVRTDPYADRTQDACLIPDHASGRRIVEILGKKTAELSDSDYAHMRKVVGYVHRHSAQRPANIYTSRWRYSLMNWGHDPTKEDSR